MVQKPVMNNVQKGTGQRKVRPVWNNALKTDHQNFSNSKRNFAPTAVLTKSGIVPISTARQRSSRAAVPLSATRPINTVAPKLFMNAAKTKLNVGNEAVHKELSDRMERAATTAYGSEAEQDSDAQTRFEAASKSLMIHLSQELTHLDVGRTV
ncbi:hypothetical protein Tco_0027731 [Tanacetum coccineum]